MSTLAIVGIIVVAIILIALVVNWKSLVRGYHIGTREGPSAAAKDGWNRGFRKGRGR